MSFQTGAKAKA